MLWFEGSSDVHVLPVDGEGGPGAAARLLFVSGAQALVKAFTGGGLLPPSPALPTTKPGPARRPSLDSKRWPWSWASAPRAVRWSSALRACPACVCHGRTSRPSQRRAHLCQPPLQLLLTSAIEPRLTSFCGVQLPPLVLKVPARFLGSAQGSWWLHVWLVCLGGGSAPAFLTGELRPQRFSLLGAYFLSLGGAQRLVHPVSSTQPLAPGQRTWSPRHGAESGPRGPQASTLPASVR